MAGATPANLRRSWQHPLIAVDTNILVYAHRRESRLGEAAHSVMVALAESDEAWAIPWPCCYEFLSVVTNRRIWKDKATKPDHAWRQFTAWAGSPSHRMIGETDVFIEILERIVIRPNVVGGAVHDRDFSLFPELVTRDPFE